MSKKLTFQEIILTLQQYWNDQGCMLMQAYDTEAKDGSAAELAFSYKRPLIKRSGKTGCSGTVAVDRISHPSHLAVRKSGQQTVRLPSRRI